MNQEIDFVIPWVDGGDPEWRKRKALCSGEETSDEREERYRDWDLLRYWFRGAERFAPWVRKVFFVCDQKPPAWLNTGHDKLVVVRHEDYLPEAYRPCFSSHPIELNFHRIQGLSEQFVYFNDDMYLLKPVESSFFFLKGIPRDAALLNPLATDNLRDKQKENRIFTIPLNNTEYLNRDYDFRSCVRKHPGKWFSVRYGKSMLRNLFLTVWPRFVGFDDPHLPQAFLKSSFEAAWDKDFDILDATSRHALRDDRDVNQWLIRERQLAEGAFMPRSPKRGRVFDLDRESGEVVRAIREQRYAMVCLNDGPLEEDELARIREELANAFGAILPEKSGFEKD